MLYTWNLYSFVNWLYLSWKKSWEEEEDAVKAEKEEALRQEEIQE